MAFIALLILVVVASPLAIAEDRSVLNEGAPDGTLSAAIRAGGHPCAKVIEKKRVGDVSAVWQVRCNSGRYEVTAKDDSAFDVISPD